MRVTVPSVRDEAGNTCMGPVSERLFQPEGSNLVTLLRMQF